MKKYFITAAAAFLMLQASAQTINRAVQPKPGPAPAINFADPAKYTLPNGITLLVVEDHRLPKVSASYSIDAGPVYEGSKAGSFDLLGSMLNEGTTKLTKAQFDEAVDKMGATVTFSATSGGCSALTRYFADAFGLFAQGLTSPAFTAESFDKVKTQTITELKSNERSAKAIAGRVTNALVYGKNHPEGEFTTVESLQKLTLADVKEAYAKYVTPSRGYLTIVGDIKPADALKLATSLLGSWQGNKLSLPQVPQVSNVSTPEIDVIDVPNAVQTEIRVVNLVNLPKSSPDVYSALMANYILGGGSESRLFMDLREKHGFTYGAYSSIGTGRFQTTFTASASVRNAKADSAIAAFIADIKAVCTDKANEVELAAAKAIYNGSFALGMEDPSKAATYSNTILTNNLPADYYRTYLQRINAVTIDEVQRAAQKYFNPGSLRIIAVGKAEQILPGIKKLGYPVKLYDTYANPVADAPKTTAVAAPAKSAISIVKAYLQAIGGEANLASIKTISSNLKVSIQGMTLAAQQKQQANKSLTTLSMGSNVVFKSVFNGATGYQMQMGNKRELDADDIAEKKDLTSMFEQVDYVKNPAFKLTVKGVQKVNGADAYQVEIVYPSGLVFNDFYDVKTALLLKTEKNKTHNGVTTNNYAEYSDYKKAGDLLLPYKTTLTQQTGGGEQVIVMEVTDIALNSGVTDTDFN